MNARVSKEEMALLMPTSLSQYAPISSPSYDEPATTGRGGLAGHLAAALRWIVELPTRRAVMAELTTLSDHELADIGLTRAELGRVFDPSFIAQRDGERSRAAARRADF